MPTRIVRDGILTSPRVDLLSEPAEVFYRRLMSVCDDHGRYWADPTMLISGCYPRRIKRVTEKAVESHLAECRKAKLLTTYEVDGQPYLQMLDFGQRINGKSKFPAIPGESPGSSENPRLDGGGVEDEGGDGDGGPDGPAPCPHKEIIALYHELLPTSPRIKVWSGEREAHLRARWREDPKRQDLDYWRRFFAHCAKSDFLTGRACSPGKRPFHGGLDWLVNPTNFAKVIEGRYHDVR